MTPQELQQVLKQHAQDEDSKDAAAGFLALLIVFGVYVAGIIFFRVADWSKEYFRKRWKM